MELISQLKSVLKPDFIQQPRAGSDTLTLRDGESNMEVALGGVSSPFIAIRMSDEPKDGEGSKHSPMHLLALRNRRDLKKICDYLLVGQWNDRAYAILVELKETYGSRARAKAKKQLLHSLPPLEYLLSACAVEQNNGEKFNLTTRHVLIVARLGESLNKRLDKRRVRGGRGEKLEQETYKSIQIRPFVGPFVHFRALTQG